MTKKKVAWTCIVSSCYKATGDLSEPEQDKLERSSFRRLSLTDVSNPSSPYFVEDISHSFIGSNLHMFSFAELRVVTHNFARSNLLGEGGFGPVFKGFIDDKLRPGLEAQPVAVKSLDLNGMQGHKEWMAEIFFLGQLRHQHLVKLIGYCCEEDQRLLVYEFITRGCLENQLFSRYAAALPWLTRMKIALGAAKGLAFLLGTDQPVIFRDLKTSNILLDSDYTAKLSDFGLAKDGPEGEETHVTTRVMGTQGYAAPEYIMTGHLTTMSDVYSFGVVLLELITGRRSMDENRPLGDQHLVEWAKPLLKDPNKIGKLIDPRLEGQFPLKGTQEAAVLAYKCLSYRPKPRPQMSDVVTILESLQDCRDAISEPFVYIIPKENDESKDFCSGEAIKGEGEKDSSGENGHPRSRRRGWRHRAKLPISFVSYSDSALYHNLVGLNFPDHRL